jgi:hypothetical protein
MTSEVLIRRVLLAAGALLALFHVWLFAGQAWEGQLADPAVLFRWLFAGALVAALVALRRQGASIFRGRKAVAIWVLAALLHGPAAARSIDGLGEPALPEFVSTLAQILVASGATLGLAWALGRARMRRFVAGVPARRISVIRLHRGVSSGYPLVQLLPRPPPAR